ncbi:MAG: SH3 domain-containing protein [Candidatus Promineifilaceae bacterium]
MADQQSSENSYNFESQLELGEMLLELGRFEEAAVELKKAKDLNEIGAYSRSDEDPERAQDLDRLATALERSAEIQGTAQRRGRAIGFAFALLLIALTAGVFIAWSLNRTELQDMQEIATREAEVVSLQRTEESSLVNYQLSEATRMSEQITDLFQQLGVIAVQATQSARTFGEAAAVSTVAAQSVGAQETLSAIMAEIAAESTITARQAGALAAAQDLATRSPAQELPTPLSGAALNELIDQIRVDTFAANLRSGPGFNFPIEGRLIQGQLLTVLAKSPDHYWFSVTTADGDEGWVHTSLAKPVSLDWLPEAATVPATPIIQPTAQPTLTPASAAPTPEPPTPTPSS